MSKSTLPTIVAAGLLGALLGIAIYGTALHASPPSQSPSQYQYVGVANSIARVNTVTGDVEILAIDRDPMASLVNHTDRRKWAWRPIKLATESATVRPAGRELGGDGADDERGRP